MDFDIAVIGAGMAGASIASAISGRQRVLLIEREEAPGYHTTGRSAALYTELYGNGVVRELTTRGRPFFEAPPRGFLRPLLGRRGCLYAVQDHQLTQAEALEQNARERDVLLQRLSPAEITGTIPLLKTEAVAFGLYEPHSMDIDVDGLHRGYLRAAAETGARLITGQRPRIDAAGDGWSIALGGERIECRVIVNAAGAWADTVAEECGLSPRGLTPHRRTVALVDPPPQALDPSLDSWPAVIDIAEEFYFKPESGKLLCSPADEHPSAPCDAAPEEIDIAVAVDRMQALLDFPVRRIASSWAGLRTFTADKTPVVGFDGPAENFFWFAGQGGYGIQMAPALAELGAQLLTGGPLSDRDRELAAAMRPQRLPVRELA